MIRDIKSRTDVITNSSTETFVIKTKGSPERVEGILRGILDTLDWVGHDTATLQVEGNSIMMTGIEDNSIPTPLINLLEGEEIRKWFNEITDIKSYRI